MDVIADFEAMIRDVRDARPVPFSASAIVDRKQLLERLEALVEAVPGELKKARWVIEDRDEVLARIQREAQQTLEQARRERDRMLSRQEIDRAASAEAERIIDGAKSQAREIRLEAEHFVDGKLASLEVGLQKMLALVQSAAGSFPDRSAPVKAAPPRRSPQPRPSSEGEQARLRPSDPLQMPHDEAHPAPPAAGKSPAMPRERPKAQRPAPRPRPDEAPPGPAAGQPEASTPAPTAATHPPGTVRSLGLGSPQPSPRPRAAPARLRARAQPGGAARGPEPPAPLATRIIRLEEAEGPPEPQIGGEGAGPGENPGGGSPTTLF